MGRRMGTQIVWTEVIEPAGGVERFRLIRFSDNSKSIQYERRDGTILDLLLEEDGMAAATVAFLERAGVPEMDWRDPSLRKRKKSTPE